MKVSKEFVFHAAHFDAAAPIDDQCRRIHGHSYRLVIVVEGVFDRERGMVTHGNNLKEAYKQCIEPHVEHQFLNETLPFLNPTMENVCEWIASKVTDALLFVMGPALSFVTVRLWETPTMYAEVTHFPPA